MSRPGRRPPGPHWRSKRSGSSRRRPPIASRELPKLPARELVDPLFEQPYCRIGDVVERGIAKRHAASRHLHELASIGLLEKRKVGREGLFVNADRVSLLREERGDPAAA